MSIHTFRRRKKKRKLPSQALEYQFVVHFKQRKHTAEGCAVHDEHIDSQTFSLWLFEIYKASVFARQSIQSNYARNKCGQQMPIARLQCWEGDNTSWLEILSFQAFSRGNPLRSWAFTHFAVVLVRNYIACFGLHAERALVWTDT